MGESRWAVRRLALGRMLSATGSEVAAIALPFGVAVNAVSFALSAALALSIRGIRFSKSDDRDAEPRGDIMEGFRVVWADDLLRRLTLSGWLLMYLAMNIAFVADPPLATSFGVGALGYGLIDTFFGAGALIGALYARRIDEASERRWFTLGLLGVAAGWGVIAATPWFGLVLAASLGAAALDAVGGVAAYGIVQRRTEDRVRARVFAAMHTLGLFANAIGFLLVGPLVEAFGPRAVYAAGGVVALVATAVFLVPARAVPAEAGATPAPPERV